MAKQVYWDGSAWKENLPTSNPTASGTLTMNGKGWFKEGVYSKGETSVQGTEVNTNCIIKQNISVPAASFVKQTTPTYSGFSYKAEISVTGVTASHYPDIVLGPTDFYSGNYANVCETTAGKLIMYAKEPPSTALTILTAVFIKGV